MYVSTCWRRVRTNPTNPSLVLGLLDPVTVDNCDDSFSLTWSPPFSLNVTEGEPDIWYTVIITDVTVEDNPKPVSCTDCLNLTQPHYTFNLYHPRQIHTFVVIPQNGAGNGNASNVIYSVEGQYYSVMVYVCEVV